MPFVYKGQKVNSNGGQELEKMLLTDSTEYTIGDVLRFNGVTGLAVLAGAGVAVYGILVGFEKANGGPLTDNGAGGTYRGTYTTPSSNTVYGVVDTSRTSLWSAVADAALGTTSGSNKKGVNFDIPAASDQIDESTVQSAGTSAQFASYGPDPDPSAPDNSVLVSIQESQLHLNA